MVDYSNYLNALNGTPVAGNYLMGVLGSSTVLTSGTTYEVLGTLIDVPAGQMVVVRRVDGLTLQVEPLGASTANTKTSPSAVLS